MSRFVSLLLLLLLYMHLLALQTESHLRQSNFRGRIAVLERERDEIYFRLRELTSLETVRIAARKEGMIKAGIADTDLHELPEDIISVRVLGQRPQSR